MAKIVQKGFNKTVQTILDRDAIPADQLIEGTTVTVENAVDDVDAGQGKATYVYTKAHGWRLVAKDSYNSVSFTSDKLIISNGEVTPSNIPASGTVWGVQVLDGNEVLADLDQTQLDLTTDPTKVKGIPAEFNGKTLRLSYGYGSITQQMSVLFEQQENKATTGVI